MGGDDDEIFGASPRKAAPSREIGQGLEDLSVQEIDERIRDLAGRNHTAQGGAKSQISIGQHRRRFFKLEGRVQTSQWGLMIHGHSDRP
jgi:hypothetical protein